jgi:diguanylate cyclase (GGDEF)-like protein/PAS domain S-box-containing protein
LEPELWVALPEIAPMSESFLFLAFSLGMVALCLCVVFQRLEARAYRKALRRDQDGLRQWGKRLADAMFDGVLIHRNGKILSMNRALVRMLGCREVEMLGQHFATLAVASQAASLRAEMDAPSNAVVEFTLVAADKTERLVEMSSQTIEHEGMPATVTAVRDITARRGDALRIARLMNHDGLTGLASRNLFIERLAAAISKNDAAGGSTALFIIDLDRFKAVNAQLGRANGDQLLRLVANRLAGMAQESDTVARISGDKFAILQPHSGAANRMMTLASRLEAAFDQPFVVDGQMVKASMSIGMAVYPDHATDADGLMKAANFALSLAAAEGGGCSHMFNHAEVEGVNGQAGPAAASRAVFRAGLSETQRLAQDLRGALGRGEIAIEYQPVFRTPDLSLAGFEALARWLHPVDGWISPTVFIPLAEQAGLIQELSGFVLEQACARAAAAGGNLVMAVNISPVQFRSARLAVQVAEILRKTGLAPGLLELEVTESLLIENAEAAKVALKAIRAIGVGVALDDFGTGYSSLSYLCDFPFSKLKIDKRFVQALGRDKNAAAVIAAIISLARNLSLDVTAEGIETPAQLAFLQEQGCHLAQGYLLGRPGPEVRQMAPLIRPGARPALKLAT